MLNDELLTYLFDGQPHLLAPPLAAWLAASRRFAAFVNAFHTKIRKKLRATQELEGLLDLQIELETAYRLLQEPSFSLVYEPQPLRQVRGPDFAVTFTTSAIFMVEVTRLRAVQEQAKVDPPKGERLTDMVCGKLGQLLPRRPNILLVGAAGFTQDTLRAAMLHLQQRAERNESAIVQRHGFRDRADFFNHYQRLSEILVRGPGLQAAEPIVTWVNPQAKHPLPTRVRTVLYHSQAV